MLTRRGLLVRELTPQQKQELSIKIPVFNVFKTLKFWKPCPDGFLVPSFWKPYETLSPSIQNVTTIQVPFSGTLNEVQIDAQQKALRAFRSKRGGLLCLPTGFGKTVLALNLVSCLGKKTLIVVHKDNLKDQWVSRIRQFLPTARIGSIQGTVIDVHDKDIVVAMIQSLSMKDYPLEHFLGFGLCVIDECHHCPAETFHQVFFKATCPFMLGLTATPFRKDGLHSAYKWFLGDLIVHIENKVTSRVEVQGISFSDPVFERPEPLNRMGELNMALMVSDLAVIPKRNELIVNLVTKHAGQGRQILVLGDRRAHCEELVEMIAQKGVQVGLLIGGLKKEISDVSLEQPVIVATYSLVSEGFDLPRLDTLILASPRSDVVQAAGRILRSGGQRKNHPLILDIQDQYSVFYAQSKKRQAFYRSAGFECGQEDHGFVD